jgi:hypothetical protein
MHLVYVTHSILDLGSIPEGLTYAILIGGLYGFARLAVDAVRLVRFILIPPQPKPPPGP